MRKKRWPAIAALSLACLIAALIGASLLAAPKTPDLGLGSPSSPNAGSSTSPNPSADPASLNPSNPLDPAAPANLSAEADSPPLPALNSNDLTSEINPAKAVVEPEYYKILQSRTTYLLNSITDDDRLVREIVGRDALRNSFERFQRRFNRQRQRFLSLRAQPSRQEDILAQMLESRNQLTQTLGPLVGINESLDQKQEDLEAIKKELDISIIPADFPEPDPRRTYEKAQKQLDLLNVKLDSFIAQGEAISTRFDSTVTEIKASVPGAWRAYYLESLGRAGVRFGFNRAFFRAIEKWWQNFADDSPMASFILPRTAPRIKDCLFRFFVTMALTFALGIAITKSIEKTKLSLKESLSKLLKSHWLWMILGFSLFVASRRVTGGYFLFLKLPSVLMIVWGLASFSWRLRHYTIHKKVMADRQANGQIPVDRRVTARGSADHNREREKARRSPLARIYPPAAFGVTLLFVDFPAAATTIVWALTLAFYLIWLFKIEKYEFRASNNDGQSDQKQSDKPKKSSAFIERISYSSSIYFAIISLFITIIGYPRLAILVFMLLFILINVLILSRAFIDLIKVFGATLFKSAPNASPVPKPQDGQAPPRPKSNVGVLKRGVFESMAIPLACLLSFGCALPWVLSAPGLNFFLNDFLQLHLTIGSATFELSRVVLISFLFLLFRSLKNVSQAFLDHLPDSEYNPGLTKEFVSPIKTLTVYLIWLVYGIIALALIGFNFMSLAVVAGGLSVGLGFAFQALLGNLISGLTLMFSRQIKEEDMIEVEGVYGRVKKIFVNSTEIQTLENATILVPNSKITSDKIINWTYGDQRVVLRKLLIPIFFDVKIDFVTGLLEEVFKEAVANNNVILKPVSYKSAITIDQFKGQEIVFALYVSVDNIDKEINALSYLRTLIIKCFKDNDIQISKSILTITLKR
ncbi:MAG: mechanosensitive ion channel [Deltaproteobacteria bacterium]|jgi:small-conductance mechanosensitive channel|nr:mechanosensitive ion channel [Deltaproteobacteria bacterium]